MAAITDKYFDKLPKISYDGKQCIDLTRRVALDDKHREAVQSYYAYTVSPGMRADTIASQYYSSYDFDWLVYMSSDILDPYYGWYLDPDSFEQFVAKKYGSREEAQKKILFWRIDWAASSEEITPAYWKDTLAESLKKYYTANFGDGSRIISYTRKRVDWAIDTNMVMDLVHSESDTIPAVGERLTHKSGVTVTGNSVVAYANSSTLRVQDVQGTVDAGYTVTTSSNAVFTVTDRDYVANTIPEAERDYWSPVYAYDWEYEKNEYRKHIRLIDPKYSLEISRKATEKFEE